MTAPSNGEVTSSVRPLAAGCHLPPISISICKHQPVSASGAAMRPQGLMNSTLHDRIHQVNRWTAIKNPSSKFADRDSTTG